MHSPVIQVLGENTHHALLRSRYTEWISTKESRNSGQSGKELPIAGLRLLIEAISPVFSEGDEVTESNDCD